MKVLVIKKETKEAAYIDFNDASDWFKWPEVEKKSLKYGKLRKIEEQYCYEIINTSKLSSVVRYNPTRYETDRYGNEVSLGFKKEEKVINKEIKNKEGKVIERVNCLPDEDFIVVYDFPEAKFRLL